MDETFYLILKLFVLLLGSISVSLLVGVVIGYFIGKWSTEGGNEK